MRHIIPISGKDSAATALVQMARQPNFRYDQWEATGYAEVWENNGGLPEHLSD